MYIYRYKFTEFDIDIKQALWVCPPSPVPSCTIRPRIRASFAGGGGQGSGPEMMIDINIYNYFTFVP